MRLFRGVPNPFPAFLHGGVVTWGVFDGVHRGHVKVLNALTFWGRRRKCPTVAVTFDRHPAEVLRGESVPLVCPLVQRVRLITARGVDAVVILPFTVEFSKTTAEEFVRDIVQKRLGVKAILLGHDSRFGKDREGDLPALEEMAKKLGLAIESCEPERRNGRPLSSSMVREAVQAGNLAEAAEILGRPFALYGVVVPGEGRGTKIGIPTANLELDHELRPPRGVYAVEVTLDGKAYAGGANLGSRPTFHPEGGPEIAEVHLLDYEGPPLTGRALEVRLRERVRDERRFSGPEELVRQIRSDLDWIRTKAGTWSSTPRS